VTATSVAPLGARSLTVPRGRLLRVERVMGTVFSIDVRDHVPGAALDEAVALLHDVDAVFSTWRAGSPVSRLARGEVSLSQCPAEVADVLEECARWHRETSGWFDARASGRLDPSGLVKGWAVQRVSDLLTTAGSRHHCVNGGGDLALRGAPRPGGRWRVGLADPDAPGGLHGAVAVTDGGVATSGSAERGRHVLDPRTGAPADAVRAVTVIGPDVVTADVWATAAVAAGPSAPELLRGSGLEHVLLMADGARHVQLGADRR